MRFLEVRPGTGNSALAVLKGEDEMCGRVGNRHDPRVSKVRKATPP